jgi:hypothetical protein
MDRGVIKRAPTERKLSCQDLSWHILKGFSTRHLRRWRLKAGSGNTDAIEWQKTFNVKKIQFTDSSGSQMTLSVLLAFLIEIMVS